MNRKTSREKNDLKTYSFCSLKLLISIYRPLVLTIRLGRCRTVARRAAVSDSQLRVVSVDTKLVREKKEGEEERIAYTFLLSDSDVDLTYEGDNVILLQAMAKALLDEFLGRLGTGKDRERRTDA
jgi:hypothetical protein